MTEGAEERVEKKSRRRRVSQTIARLTAINSRGINDITISFLDMILFGFAPYRSIGRIANDLSTQKCEKSIDRETKISRT
jgi:hypothetical protein